MGHHVKYQELLVKKYRENEGGISDEDEMEIIVASMEKQSLNRNGEEMKKVLSLLFNICHKTPENRYKYVDYMGDTSYATKLKKVLIEYSIPRTIKQAINESKYEGKNIFDD